MRQPRRLPILISTGLLLAATPGPSARAFGGFLSRGAAAAGTVVRRGAAAAGRTRLGSSLARSRIGTRVLGRAGGGAVDDVVRAGADDVARAGADDVIRVGADDVIRAGADDVVRGSSTALVPAGRTSLVPAGSGLVPAGGTGIASRGVAATDDLMRGLYDDVAGLSDEAIRASGGGRILGADGFLVTTRQNPAGVFVQGMDDSGRLIIRNSTAGDDVLRTLSPDDITGFMGGRIRTTGGVVDVGRAADGRIVSTLVDDGAARAGIYSSRGAASAADDVVARASTGVDDLGAGVGGGAAGAPVAGGGGGSRWRTIARRGGKASLFGLAGVGLWSLADGAQSNGTSYTGSGGSSYPGYSGGDAGGTVPGGTSGSGAAGSGAQSSQGAGFSSMNQAPSFGD